MEVQPDFRELLALFNANQVDYMVIGDIPVYYIGREQFTANKRATGRKRDLADLEALGEE